MLLGGGTDNQCIRLVQNLRKLGEDARIIGHTDRLLSATVRNANIPLIPLPSKGKLAQILRISKEIRHGGYQIVHTHHGRDYWTTYLAWLLSFRRSKLVFTRHMAKSPSSLPSRLAILKIVDRLIAVSEFTAHVMKEGHDEPDSPEEERHHRPPLLGDHSKITVIPCGIDTGVFVPSQEISLRKEWGVSEDDYLFAVVGGYDLPRGKGQREYLKAAGQIADKIPNAKFLIVGDGSMRELLLEDIRRLGLEGRAILTPWCKNMPAAMNTIDCLVHPAIGTEAYGLVLLEAFACGKPVIASELDGIPEAFHVVGEGQLVPPEDVTTLAQAMEKLYHLGRFAREKRLTMHKKVAETADLTLLAKRTLALYQKLLDDK